MHRAKRAWWLLLAVAVAWLDLWSKGLWRYPRTIHDPPVLEKVVFESWLQIRTVFNTGAVWSLPLGEHFLLYGTALAIPLILVWIFRANKPMRLETAAKALILGGALGNLYDRYRWRAVRDFIDVFFGDVGGWHWPTFNVADMCLMCGIGGLLVLSFLHGRQDPKPAKSTEAKA